MALNPLRVELRRTGYSYWMSTGRSKTAKLQLVSHLLYMDHLKSYARNPDHLKGTQFIHSLMTQMKFDLDKCAIAHFANGKLSGHNSGVTVGKLNTINCLELSQIYKYWVWTRVTVSSKHSTMWETLRREYFRKVKMVLQTKLYGWNKILAINEFALHVLT